MAQDIDLKIITLQDFLLECSKANHSSELKLENALLLHALYIKFIEHTSQQIIISHYSTKK